MPNLNLNRLTKKDRVLIPRILKRFKKLGCHDDLFAIGRFIPFACLNADLDLQKLLDFDDYHFKRDVRGITKNFNRRTGKFENSFLPRCHS